MNYIFSGNIKGCYLNNCFDHVHKTKVRIYGIDKSISVRSNINLSGSQTVQIRTEGEIANISQFLIAETETNQFGDYSISLDENYDGGTLDIDICCDTPPIELATVDIGYKSTFERQFNITTIQPFWKVSNEQSSLIYHCKHEIDAKIWASLLNVFKLHIICGRVSYAIRNEAISKARVSAYDLDLLQDDYLGEAFTDNNGCFKIIYHDGDYQKTIFKNMSSEWRNCPDIYFRIENEAGRLILKEDRKCGNARNRRNASPSMLVNFEL